MSKRKGLSLEDKRTRMLEIFHEKRDFFQLKELEKIAPKEKGIIMQSVKEVVQSLVDDSLVDTDKIGTSVYFWSYPSKAMHIKRQKLDEVTVKITETEKRLHKVQDKLAESKLGKEESDSRTQLLESIIEYSKKRDELLNEIKLYKDNDPEVYEKLKQESMIAKDAANRWTDNLFAIKSWCAKKFMIDENVLNKQFEIPADIDYIN